jgi:ATP synthase protein I
MVKQEKFPPSINWFSLSSLGLNLVVATVIGFGLGFILDSQFHTHPYLTLIFFVLGIASGFWQIIKEIKKINADEKCKK